MAGTLDGVPALTCWVGMVLVVLMEIAVFIVLTVD